MPWAEMVHRKQLSGLHVSLSQGSPIGMRAQRSEPATAGGRPAVPCVHIGRG